VQGLQVQLVIALDRHKAHGRPGDSLRDRFSIDVVALVRLQSRLLQGDGFVSVSQRVALRSRRAPCASDGCDRYSCFTAGNHVPRSVSLGFRGSAAFASRTVHPSHLPPDLIRRSTVWQTTGLSLFPSPLST
jgi:hypothetical protein